MHDQMGTEGLILRLACDLQQWKSSVLKTYDLSGSAFLSQHLATHHDSIVVLDQKGRNSLPFTTQGDEAHNSIQCTALYTFSDAMQKAKSRGYQYNAVAQYSQERPEIPKLSSPHPLAHLHQLEPFAGV